MKTTSSFWFEKQTDWRNKLEDLSQIIVKLNKTNKERFEQIKSFLSGDKANTSSFINKLFKNKNEELQNKIITIFDDYSEESPAQSKIIEK